MTRTPVLGGDEGPRFSEDGRQLVHIAMGGFALLLRYLSWWEGAVLAGVAIAFNLYALPANCRRAAVSPARVGQEVLLGRHALSRLHPAAALRAARSAATSWPRRGACSRSATAWRRWWGDASGPRIPWNREKSLAGSLAFVLAGGAAASFLCWWCRPVIIPPPYPWFSLAMPFVAALAAAAVETIPIRLDDNISVTATAAAVLWCGSLVSEDLIAAAAGPAVAALPVAIAANAGVAVAGYFARTVSAPGAVAGAALGIVILLSAGWRRMGAPPRHVCGRGRDVPAGAAAARPCSGSPRIAAAGAAPATRSRTPGSRRSRRCCRC